MHTIDRSLTEATNGPSLVPPRRSRKAALALSISLALGSISADAAPAPERPAAGTHAATVGASSKARSLRAPQSWTVSNCSDHDDGSLRSIIASPTTMSGDTVDLSQLPTLCGATDSRITLSTGEIAITQDALRLQGPFPGGGTVTISGGGNSRVLNHSGYQTLEILNLNITEGSFAAVDSAVGGCILSEGSVYLTSTNVTSCDVTSSNSFADGGAIFAFYDVHLVSSVISGNHAGGTQGAAGGGVGALGTLLSKYTAFTGNDATSTSYATYGGAAAASQAVGIYHSALVDNYAKAGAGVLTSGTLHIANSTLSGNHGDFSVVHVSSGASASLEISNSTITANHINNDAMGAVYFRSAQASDPIALYSSIIAGNTAGASNAAADIYLTTGHALSGANNAVIASNVAPPAGVVTVPIDPKLGPLQTPPNMLPFHLPQPDSPVLGKGSNTRTFPPNDANTNDQRGLNYPRTTTIGGVATVDIGAIQFDRIFIDRFD